jgi:hypothetical protein
MGDSQTSTSGTSIHRHSQTSSDGGALRNNITEVQIEETSVYVTLDNYTTVKGLIFG